MKRARKWSAAVLSGAMAMSMVPGMAMADETSVPEIDWSQYATAADNGIELPELEGGVLKVEANIADFNQSSDGTMIQQLWEQAMEHYLGVDVEVTFNRTPWADYRTNELVRLAGDDVADANTYSQGTAIQQYGEDGVVLNLADYQDYIKYYWKVCLKTSCEWC